MENVNRVYFCNWQALVGKGGQHRQSPVIGHDRTCRERALTAEFDPKETWSEPLLDHLVGALLLEMQRHFEAQCLRGLEVDDELLQVASKAGQVRRIHHFRYVVQY